MAWQTAAVSLALGSVAFVVMYVVKKVQQRRQMNQSYQTSSFREEQRENSQRNIICPFCNKFVRENDQRLSCGHRCHKSCYQNQPAKNKKCTYCPDLNEEPTTSSTRNSRRSSTPMLSAQSSRRSSISNECCFCKFPVQSVEGTSKLDCKHSAHKECFTTYNTIMQCQACNAKKYY